MEKGKIRMLANLIELNKIEVRLSKKYYGGISPKFYLRDLNKETLVEILLLKHVKMIFVLNIILKMFILI